jgi:hypothetical protein
MKLVYHRLLLLIPFFFLSSAARGFILSKGYLRDTTSYVSPFFDDNERCFKCHGQRKYEYTNESLGRQVKALMCSEMVTGRDEYYSSNHKSFRCTDCHSPEYDSFPHPGALLMELQYTCLDCHGGDETFSRFRFEEIDSGYRQSIHFRLEEEGFSCWKCHDPHSYKISIRNSENLKLAISYDNAICLNCHSDYKRFSILSDHSEVNLVQKHDWLPYQTEHFKSVRCIECHTKTNDSILVSHLILPEENAVRNCNECHSKNSMLMASLYKFQSEEKRKMGFINAIFLSESFVVGANRNVYLDAISIVIFAIIILVIGVHVFFRIIMK